MPRRLGNLPPGFSMEQSRTIDCRKHWRQRTQLKTHHRESGWSHATIQEWPRTALVEAYWCSRYQVLLCRVRSPRETFMSAQTDNSPIVQSCRASLRLNRAQKFPRGESMPTRTPNGVGVVAASSPAKAEKKEKGISTH